MWIEQSVRPIRSGGRAGRDQPIWRQTRPYACGVLELPRAARLTIWFNAWVRGAASTDGAREAVVGGDAAHHLTGLPDDPEAVPIVLGLGRLRNLGASEGRLALPAPGDPLGLGGPISFNEQTLEAGEGCVLAGSGLGLVPDVVGGGVFWRVHPAEAPPGLPDLVEADRELRAALASTADQLAGLQLARWRPDVADELIDLRASQVATGWAPGYPPRSLAVASAALRALAIVSLALAEDHAQSIGDDGPVQPAALDPAHLTPLDRAHLAPLDRAQPLDRGHLAPLDRAARRALVAACAAPPADR
jgi:hypothetical protein